MFVSRGVHFLQLPSLYLKSQQTSVVSTLNPGPCLGQEMVPGTACCTGSLHIVTLRLGDEDSSCHVFPPDAVIFPVCVCLLLWLRTRVLEKTRWKLFIYNENGKWFHEPWTRSTGYCSSMCFTVTRNKSMS